MSAARDKQTPGRGGRARVLALLESIPADRVDELFPLLREGPKVVDELTGDRPHKSTLLRHASTGVRGTKLETISRGRTMLSTRRWLIEFWAQVDAARRHDRRPSEPKPRKARPRKPRHLRTPSARTKEILARHRLPAESAKAERDEGQ